MIFFYSLIYFILIYIKSFCPNISISFKIYPYLFTLFMFFSKRQSCSLFIIYFLKILFIFKDLHLIHFYLWDFFFREYVIIFLVRLILFLRTSRLYQIKYQEQIFISYLDLQFLINLFIKFAVYLIDSPFKFLYCNYEIKIMNL